MNVKEDMTTDLYICSFVMNLVFNLILLPVMRTLINNPKSLIISCNIIRSLFDPVVFCL